MNSGPSATGSPASPAPVSASASPSAAASGATPTAAGAARIQLVLVSHTNSGKTTLARTLLGLDVGEVRDAAHVTTTAESHTLLATSEGDALELWDTPGFGDSVRLLKRLGNSDNPIGWFLREVLDRYRDRSFWLSQQALRAARVSADVVLYLVNASEDPRDTGYLPPEMRILAWLSKPVLVLLNQTGPPLPPAQAGAEERAWEQYLAQYPAVRRVLALDAFARCWMHERVFYEAIAPLLAASRAAGYTRLLAAWRAGNQQRFDAAMRITARQIAVAAQDSQPVQAPAKSRLRSMLHAVGMGEKRFGPAQAQAMNALTERLNRSIADSTAQLLVLHRIAPGQAAKINARVQKNFVLEAPLDKTQAGLLGAVLSGAATGVGADLAAGGLTMGAGALLGGVVGALTFAGAAWGFNAMSDRNAPTVRFTDAFLHDLLASSVLRYLTIAHFGRGRGNFEAGEAPAFWQAEVAAAMAEHGAQFGPLWRALRTGNTIDESCDRVHAMLTGIATRTLQRLYPEAPRST